MIITKEEIAIIHLIEAIELFTNNHFLTSITLAGASEEVLAQLIKIKSHETNIPYPNAEEIEKTLFELNKDIFTFEEYHLERNKIKNELKHHGSKWNLDSIDVDLKQIALKHISGSIQNYKILHNHLPKEEKIQKFCNLVGIS